VAGRLAERQMSMADLGGDRHTYQYDDSGRLISETIEDHRRSEEPRRRHVRFEYRHDAQGNWTARVVWSRLEPNPNFERSNAERRQISYYAGPAL